MLDLDYQHFDDPDDETACLGMVALNAMGTRFSGQSIPRRRSHSV